MKTTFATLMLQGVLCLDDPSLDIALFVGNQNWWSTSQSLDEFSVEAQDPEFIYSATMNQDSHASHIMDSLTEASFLLDTSENRFDDLCAGFTN